MSTSYKILHLEDSAIDAELISAMLTGNGIVHDTTVVNTRDDFFNFFRLNTYDLILCDYNLPGYNGLQALKELRALDQEIPYIFVSGNIGEDRAIESLRTGATDYVLKDRLARLPSAIIRAMNERAERSEKRKIDEALQSQNNFLNRIIETIPVSLMVKDKEGKILLANAMTEMMCGIPSEQIIGKTEIELNPNDKGIRQKIEDEQELFSGTPSLVIPDDRFVHRITGKVHHLLTVKVPLFDSNGKPYQILSVSSDITEQKKMEENILRAERVHNIGALASGIAHDLNNVLAPIILVIEILRMRMTDEPTIKMLKMVEDTAKRGSGLIKQVLAFARGTETERLVFQAKHIILEVEKIMKQTFPKSIQYEIEVPNDIGTIYGDVTQMHQVLMNLCVNARDAMPFGGKLIIKAENGTIEPSATSDKRSGRYVIITVTDSGIGIPSEEMPKIFEPFFTTKEIGKGTGLGLSTVKSIVVSHQGYIDVDSKQEIGTTFTLYFPRTDSEHIPEKASKKSGISMGHGETILVVDDESAMLELIKSTLESFGYIVLTAVDGSEAIVSYFQNKGSISAIVTDMMMPVMDGVVLVQTIRKVNPTIKILGMSGTTNVKGELISTEVLGIPILPKPFTMEQLLTTLQKVLKTETV